MGEGKGRKSRISKIVKIYSVGGGLACPEKKPGVGGLV